MGKLRALWKKDPGLVVSASAHVTALVLLLVNFTSAPKFDDAVETVPVEMVTTSDLNQIMNGEKTAKQMEKPQRVVDKVADLEDHKPAPPVPEAKKDTPPPPSPDKANADPGPDDKPTEKTTALPPPPPPPPVTPTPPVPTPPERPVEKVEAPTPPPKPAEVKPEPKEAEAVEPPPRPKVEKEPKKEPPKKVAKQPKKPPGPPLVEEAKVVPDPPKRPDPQPVKPDLKQRTLDQVAKLLDTLKPEKPKPEPPVKQRSGTETKDAKPSTFSFDKITAFLDHDTPQRTASTGQQLTKLASLGSPTAHADKMSPSMMARIDGWLIDHYRGCWSYFGLGATQDYVPRVHVRMAPDGSLIGHPALLNPPSDPNLRSLADSAVRAVNKCDPLPIPEWFKAHYETWRDRTVRFDPKEMS